MNISLDTTGLIILDICGTIYDSNTTFDYIEFVLRDKPLRLFAYRVFRSLPAKVLHVIVKATLRIDLIKTLCIWLLNGFKLEDLKRKAFSFVDEQLSEQKIDIVWEMYNANKGRGCKWILLSASLDVIVSVIAERMGIKEFYSSTLAFNSGVCLGRIENDLYGKKLPLVNNIIAREPAIDIVFVTDNKNDYCIRPYVKSFIAISNKSNLRFWKERLNHKDIYEV